MPRPSRPAVHTACLAALVALMALVALAATPLAAQPAPAPVTESTYDESVDVTLVTTSFYVIDAEGKPVRDLRADEVEVRVGGKVLPLAHFEVAGAELGRPVLAPGPSGPAVVPGAGGMRHVFLFFDLTFSHPRGVAAARRAATDLVAKLPASDLLYLVTYHSQRGLEQEMGPVMAAQRPALLARIAELTPAIERITLREDLQPIATGKRESFRVQAGYAETHATSRSNYAAEGVALAESLHTFAAFLRQVPGPKALLYFTQGMDSDVYAGMEAGVGASFNAPSLDVHRSTPVRKAFEPALTALAETGALLIFVDSVVGFEPGDRVEGVAVDAPAHWVRDAPTGGGTLQLMTEASGALLVRDPNLESLDSKLDSWLQARYELGVYLPGQAGGSALAADIRVKRPGVRAWTSSWLQPPRTVNDLKPPERAFLAVQLVLAADPRLAMRNVAAPPVERLEGESKSSTEGEQLHLRFEPAEWSPDMMLRGLELYSVVIVPGSPPQLARLDLRHLTPTPNREPVLSTVPSQPDLLWGLVAFDLAAGKVYLGRFPVRPAA